MATIRQSTRSTNAANRHIHAQPNSQGASSKPEFPLNILLAEDDDNMRMILARKLRRSGYRVIECRDGAELLTHLESYLEPQSDADAAERIDLIISDVRMPGVLGSSVIEGARQLESFPPSILITAFPDVDVYEMAGQSGVLAVFSKPFEVDDLLSVVSEALEQ